MFIDAVGQNEEVYLPESESVHEIGVLGTGAKVTSAPQVMLRITQAIYDNVRIVLGVGSMLFLGDNITIGTGLVVEIPSDKPAIFGKPVIPGDAHLTPDFR